MFIEKLNQAVSGKTGCLRYDEYINFALYDTEFGYYKQAKERIGRIRDADFYTASSMGDVSREPLISAFTKLLAGEQLSEYGFVEIGADSNRQFFDGIDVPFSSIQSIRCGDPIPLSGKQVVFSNELLDAQPFRRFVFKEGDWRELGVKVEGSELGEVLLEEMDSEMMEQLPPSLAEGYQIDLPTGAESLMREIVSQEWDGLLVFIDYGKVWQELITACPAGTSRAYKNHQLGKDLLAYPGEQDITCHVCWDRQERILEANGFMDIDLRFQESFFVHHANDAIKSITLSSASAMESRKRKLMELLHPHYMGQKFQVLSALRG